MAPLSRLNDGASPLLNILTGGEGLIIKIEIDENLQEDEVLIRCKEINDNIKRLQKTASDISRQTDLRFYKNNVEYYLSLDLIMFFETSGSLINAHTADNFYQVKNKLYELEAILPDSFVRVSKSTILNVSHIYSIEKNITSSSIVRFGGTHKQVYVSRNYFKILKQRIDEQRKNGI